MKKLAGILIALGLLAGGIWFASGKLKNPAASAQASATAKEETAKAERRDIEFKIDLTGDVTPAFEVEIKPEVGGKIKRLHHDTGESVKKGDLLVEIDDTDLLTEKLSAETDITGARLAVDKNRKDFQRARDLASSKLISQEVFDDIQSKLEIAENDLLRSQRKLQTVEDKLRKTKIHAPADGTILSTKVIEGQVVVAAASVNSGTSLFTLADLSRLIVVTHVNQVDVASVGIGKEATFRSEAIRDLHTKSRITFIAPVATVKNNVKGFEVEAEIVNPDARLRPGMTVSMNIPVAEAHDAVSVPLSAVFENPDKTKVVYVRRGGSTQERKVEVGVTNLFHAEITSGLEAGEEVMLSRPQPVSQS